MSIKMKKSNLAVPFAGLALILGSVLALLAGCLVDLDIGIPTTEVNTGNTGSGRIPTSGPRIEIYFDGDETVNQAGKELFWLYDQTQSTHPESARGIKGKIINGPADSPYLVWTIEPAIGLTSVPVRFTAGAVGTSQNPASPHPSGYSFQAFAGTQPGTARLWARSAD